MKNIEINDKKNSKTVDNFKHDAFIQGYICAVCCMIQMDGQVETRTREMYKQGVGKTTLNELKTIGVPENDLKILSKYWSQLN